MALLQPYFLTVFWDLTCHSCQQSPRDLLANGATAGAPRDLKKLRPLSPPLLTYPPSFSFSESPSESRHSFFSCFHLFHVPLRFPSWSLSLTLLLPRSPYLFLFLFFIFTLDLWWLGGLSYDVWLKQLFLSAPIWQSCCQAVIQLLELCATSFFFLPTLVTLLQRWKHWFVWLLIHKWLAVKGFFCLLIPHIFWWWRFAFVMSLDFLKSYKHLWATAQVWHTGVKACVALGPCWVICNFLQRCLQCPAQKLGFRHFYKLIYSIYWYWPERIMRLIIKI